MVDAAGVVRAEAGAVEVAAIAKVAQAAVAAEIAEADFSHQFLSASVSSAARIFSVLISFGAFPICTITLAISL